MLPADVEPTLGAIVVFVQTLIKEERRTTSRACAAWKTKENATQKDTPCPQICCISWFVRHYRFNILLAARTRNIDRIHDRIDPKLKRTVLNLLEISLRLL